MMGYAICAFVGAAIGYMVASVLWAGKRADECETCSNERVREYLLKAKAEEIRKGLGQ